MTDEPPVPVTRGKPITELMLADVVLAHPRNYCALRYATSPACETISTCRISSAECF
jgi:hypothetical protein